METKARLNYDIYHRENVESMILAACLIDNGPSMFSEQNYVSPKQAILSHQLVASDFCTDYHRALFTAILHCYENDLPSDLLTVSSHRPKDFMMSTQEWDYHNILISQKLASSAHIEHHIMILKEFVIIQYWEDKWNWLSNIDFMAEDVLQISDRILDEYNALFDRLKRVSNITFSNSYEEELLKKHANYSMGVSNYIASGIYNFDYVLGGGFSNGELIILAGRPGMMKTTIALIVSWELFKRGYKVLFFSLEMPENQIKNKIISKESGIPYNRIKAGELSDKELGVVMSYHKQLEGSNFKIIGNVKHIDEIAKVVKNHVQLGLCQFVAIDYLQRISTNQQDLRQGIVYMTRELKSMAKENYIPILVLSQLSRAVEQRTNKRPQLSDLKESSSIEEDADVVMFPYRHAYYCLQTGMPFDESDMWLCELNVGKGRDIGQPKSTVYVNPITLTLT